MKKFLILFLLIISGGLLWSRYLSTSGLIVKEYPVVNEKIPNSFSGIKIVHFSDLHYGSVVFEKELKNVVKKINELNPEIVVFTGDLIEKRYNFNNNDITILVDNLSNINAKIGKYSIIGNHDYSNEEFGNIMYKSGFNYLDNKSEKVYYLDSIPIEIVGVTSLIQSHPDYEKAFLDVDETFYTILLAHEPDVLLKLNDYNIDLLLSGHTHGGQVRLPFIGSIVKVAGGKTYYEEKYKVNNTDLFISSGIGTSTLKFRFFNKPSINLYRIYD